MLVQRPRSLRQTLLCFPTAPPAQEAPVEAEVEVRAPPQKAVELPAEVWSDILSDLSTIALKGFRLVCKEWSRIGTTRLFSTVYLDSFENSWVRFQQLADSQYACLTTRIVWTPLAILNTCLDSVIWQQTYPNLNRGISHTKSLQLHKLYCKLYHEWQEKVLVKPTTRVHTEALRRTMACFFRCQSVTMEDNVDVEIRCEDPFLRNRIQCDDELLQRPSIWGRLPHWWSRETYYTVGDGLDSATFVLDLVDLSANVHRLDLCLWESNLLNVLERFKWYRKEPSTAAVTNVYVQMKCCNALQPWLVDNLYTSRQYNLPSPIGRITRRFPNVGQLMVRSDFVDPGPLFLNIYQQQLRESEAIQITNYDNDGQSVSSTSHSDYSTLSTLEAEYGPLPRLRKEFRLTLRIKSLPDPWSLVPNLTLLTLHNVTLNTRTLICWLCNQTQVPYVTVTIKLTGFTIIYGLDRALFNRILRWINVRLLCDHERTYYYETELADPSQIYEYQNWTIEVPTSRNQVWCCEVEDGTPESLGQIIAPPNFEQVPELLVHGHSQSGPLPAVQFLHRPESIKKLIPTWESDSGRVVSFFVYYICIGSHVSFEWVRTEHLPPDQSPSRHAVLVVKVLLDYKLEDTYVEAWNWEHEISLAEQDEMLQGEAGFEAQEQYDQADLLVYETEYLRLGDPTMNI